MNEILTFIIKFIINLINLLLLPIDKLIQAYIPDLSNIFTNIGQLFTYIASGLGWAISFLGISQSVIALIITYYTFKLTVQFIAYTIKLAIKWYNSLKI